MNKNIAVFILLSIAFGFGAVFLAKNWLDENQGDQLNDGVVQVITVNAPLPTGSIIDTKHITINSLPESMLPEGAITKAEDAIGMVVKQKLYAGDILHSNRVGKKGEGSALASLIGTNMRAVSIRVNDVIGVSGFILPGNRVDILTTYSGASGPQTEVVLSNIKILAVDQRQSSDENKPQIVRAVTVEVSLDQAELLLSSTRRGGLQLALRNPNDMANSEGTEVTAKQAVIEDSEIEKKDEPVEMVSVNSLISRNKVEVIRGISKETVQVSN